MEKKYNYVYITTNLINGKQYIGDRSCNGNPEKDKYIGSGRPYFANAKLKYGKENFKKEILQFFPTKKEAFDAQEKYIIQYNTLNPNGYNISPKGGHGVKGCFSEETKLKIGKKSRERRYNKEQKKHMSDAHKGKKLSPEHIKNRSIAQTGLHRSEKTKTKMSISALNRSKPSIEHKKHISESLKGKFTQKQIEARKNIKRELCIYCNKEYTFFNYRKWHGEKCKNNINV